MVENKDEMTIDDGCSDTVNQDMMIAPRVVPRGPIWIGPDQAKPISS